MTDLLIYTCESCGKLRARKEPEKVNICTDHPEHKEMELMGIAKLEEVEAE